MFQKMAANAVMTAVRSKYSMHLTDENYNELLNCKTVADVAAYLKTRTKYAGYITENLPQNIHRGYLERCLKDSLYAECAQICHYEWLVGENFYQYIIMLCEMHMLSACLSSIFSGHSNDHTVNMPEFIKKHASFDFDKLRHIRDYNELMRLLKGNHYENVLKQFSEWGVNTDYGAIDAILHKHVRESMLSFVKRNYKGRTLDSLLRLLNFQCDLANLMYVYRLKTIIGIKPKYITPYLLPTGRFLTSKNISSLLETDNTEQFIAAAKKTELGKMIGLEDMDFAETKGGDVLFENSRKNLYFSSDPPVSVYSYFILAETEINNITHIIEGIRYGVDREEISQLLVNVNAGGDSISVA